MLHYIFFHFGWALRSIVQAGLDNVCLSVRIGTSCVHPLISLRVGRGLETYTNNAESGLKRDSKELYKTIQNKYLLTKRSHKNLMNSVFRTCLPEADRRHPIENRKFILCPRCQKRQIFVCCQGILR